MRTTRPARAEDAPRLAGILSDWIEETAWMPRLHSRTDTLAFVRDMIHGGGVDVLCDGERANGFLQETGGHISALYLAPSARGQGGGVMLLDAAKARSDRLDLWTFAANTGARRFYRREGFVETDTSTDNDEGLPDVRMQWAKEDTTDG